MNINTMKISVIIRSHNSQKFIRNAINSAMNQTLDKNAYEIIVVDDGSTDGTLDILEKDYKNQVRVTKQNHLGAAAASNAGIMESKGKYVMLLDSDDEFLPVTLEKMLGQLEENPLIDFAYCDYFEQTGNQRKIVSLKDNIFNSLACGILFKKKLFEDIGYYDKDMNFGEYDFLLRLLQNKSIGKYIPLPLYIYIRTKGSLTSDKNKVEKGISQLREKYGAIAEKIRKY